MLGSLGIYLLLSNAWLLCFLFEELPNHCNGNTHYPLIETNTHTHTRSFKPLVTQKRAFKLVCLCKRLPSPTRILLKQKAGFPDYFVRFVGEVVWLPYRVKGGIVSDALLQVPHISDSAESRCLATKSGWNDDLSPTSHSKKCWIILGSLSNHKSRFGGSCHHKKSPHK